MADGTIVGSSATGGRQGDDHLWLCCSTRLVGFQAVLIRIKGILADTQQRLQSAISVGVVGVVGVIGYADDTTVFGCAQVASEVIIPIQEVVEEHGMRMNVKKGCALLDEMDREDFVHHGMPVKTDGMRMLGNGIGSMEYKKRFCETLVTEMISPLPALSLIHPQSALIIVGQSINTKPGYLTRVMEWECARDALHTFDRAIEIAFALDTCQAPPSVELQQICALPPSLSGLGLIQHSSV